MDGCAELKVDAEQLEALWATCKKEKKMVKFGGGFYCAKVETEGNEPAYIFNGFFMSMRSKFTAPGTCINYFTVEWDAKDLSWADFRGKVLGPTDPAEGPEGCLRAEILAQWQDLGLTAAPNTGDNGVHASASPFEAMAERTNWLGVSIAEDEFGKRLLDAGMSEEMIKAWSVDPAVNQPGGEKGSIFDALEDMDSNECLAKCVELSKLQ